MTKTFDLTQNELSAAVAIIKDCLDGMGGNRPIDLDGDPYTWCDAQTLRNNGWTRHQAAGTYGALADKGFIILDTEGDFVSTEGYRWIDTIWDTLADPVGP